MTYGRYLLPSTVGFDKMLSVLDELGETYKTATYPPYNIVKTGENQYVIEVAVSGFKKDELELSVEDSRLCVNGSIKRETTPTYLHKGIATRDFSHTFRLADTTEVRFADMEDGMLKIYLENVIPEEKKPKKIVIK